MEGFEHSLWILESIFMTKLTWCYITDRWCGGYIRLDDGGKFISSPNYPTEYPRNARCRWSIYGGYYKESEIELQAFDTERHYDFLRISWNGGNHSMSGSLADVRQRSLKFYGHITVEFTSDSTNQRSGFLAYVGYGELMFTIKCLPANFKLFFIFLYLSISI